MKEKIFVGELPLDVQRDISKKLQKHYNKYGTFAKEGALINDCCKCCKCDKTIQILIDNVFVNNNKWYCIKCAFAYLTICNRCSKTMYKGAGGYASFTSFKKNAPHVDYCDDCFDIAYREDREKYGEQQV